MAERKIGRYGGVDVGGFFIFNVDKFVLGVSAASGAAAYASSESTKGRG